MKICPTCQQVFDTSNDFCPDDGTPLGAHSASPFNTPTQVLQTPTSAGYPATGKSTSPILYLVIGVLAAGFAAALIFIFAMRPDEVKKADNTDAAPAKENPPAPVATPASAANAVVNGPPRPVIDPTLTPAGNWTGNIAYPSGSSFSAQASFADSGDGQVTGQILWTLLRTTNSQKAGLVGSSGTEFVRGTFDPATRTLSIAGYDTSDPTGLIILDKYRLTLSANGRSFRGFSHGGKTRGQMSLQK